MTTADRPASGARPTPGCTVGRAERAASFIIFAVLAAIALGVCQRQRSFNPAVLVLRNAGPVQHTSQAQPAAPAIPKQLQPLASPESFNGDNLYDKIDGKAELYLAAGFAQMRCQRFALRQAPDQWFEWFAYGMNSVPAAFSVFSTQRRAEGQSLDLTEYAYRTQNAIYFVQDTNYVEVVASSADEPLLAAALEMAKSFVASSAAPTHVSELDLFPGADLVAGSQSLQVVDGFGFDGLKHVFTARYKLGATEITGFVTACLTEAEAARLRDAYVAFLLGNGGKETPGQDAAERQVEIMDTFELVFSQGNYVAGVHSAPAIDPARTIGARLREKLRPK